jgi:pentatricopeptide repeat protein
MECLTVDGYRVAVALMRAAGNRGPISDAMVGACGRLSRAERVLQWCDVMESNGFVPSEFDGVPSADQVRLCETQVTVRRARALGRVVRWVETLNDRARLAGWDGDLVSSWQTGGDPRSGSGLSLFVGDREVLV